jgi:glutamate N-acetyltransferase/amino-acid N-acetyltransferase
LCSQVEAELKLNPDECLVASTGVIGRPLPIEKMLRMIPYLCKDLSEDGGHNAASAIMTTDTVCKEVSIEVRLSNGSIRIGGMAKGSGMIHPNMATLLGFLTTDAEIAPDLLNKLVIWIADKSFNMITVDGDTSTNDSFFIMANGASGIALTEDAGDDFETFKAAMTYAAQKLAITMAADGEGASKLIEITVNGAIDDADAALAAKAVATSSLVKTAIYGNDANWGRIICALGYSGVEINPGNVSISIGNLQVCSNGCYLPFDESLATQILSGNWIDITIIIGNGYGKATVWTCDLTHDYIDINASYRS